ncbi:adenosylcobinamide-GDP ribazoletransferase [Oscillatoria sp. FACHB-1407]|uniref:adenosylcobinamide-GDP ribazoletransferase n=1 Tax=Oscillatoria sp. FACHB-1407 TaxID=2692847 RepID=UPI001686E79B|nr:adenosylcobinamide-GDP ribazoletransferase [Oscillatoria sp. FACHB-1407]MBD2465893.1 adenosylcobinamide-GDP ribazoletransferase [Oscillatoria sp. FACHB-1407]
MIAHLNSWTAQLVAAIAFYTVLPVPTHGALEFQWVSRWIVGVGLLIGSLLALLNWGLWAVNMPTLVRSAVVVLAWVGITGGLHLDGAMDTADGLAVQDPQRRLAVMTDSATGAFGAMAAIALILLKVTALTELQPMSAPALILTAGWGRWAQQVAIARYPYLKPTGKGAFHKKALPSIWYTLPSGVGLLALSVLFSQVGLSWQWSLSAAILGGAIALLIPAWFHHKLGGHTGDTYGATVEWTEAIVLVGLTVVN